MLTQLNKIALDTQTAIAKEAGDKVMTAIQDGDPCLKRKVKKAAIGAA